MTRNTPHKMLSLAKSWLKNCNSVVNAVAMSGAISGVPLYISITAVVYGCLQSGSLPARKSRLLIGAETLD